MKKTITTLLILALMLMVLTGCDEPATSGEQAPATKPGEPAPAEDPAAPQIPPDPETPDTAESPKESEVTPPPEPQAEIKAKGDRKLVVDITESNDPHAYGDHIATVQSLGAEQVGLFWTWDMLEGDDGYISYFIDLANPFYPQADMKVDLTLAVINTNQKNVPKDLMDKEWNDPELISRFKKLIDYLADATEFDISSLNIGSEYDIQFGGDDARWQKFVDFYKEVAPYMKSKFPNAKIATEPTYDGILGPGQKHIIEMNKHSDVVGVSFYHMKKDGKVADPKDVDEVFKTLVELFPGKKIWFYQYGYPTSDFIGGSEDLQSQFIQETFKSWDTYSNEIEMIDFTWLHDLSEEAAIEVGGGYGSTDKSFTEFLRTLGLRTYNEKDKKALDTLRVEAQARGWK